MEIEGPLTLLFSVASINGSKASTRLTAALRSITFSLPMLSALSAISSQERQSDTIPSCSSLASR